MTNLELEQIAKVIRAKRFYFQSEGIRALADLFEQTSPDFNRERWFAQIDTLRENQPTTGAKCSCRPGMERDNCPSCEGTGWRIDFAAIRARKA